MTTEREIEAALAKALFDYITRDIEHPLHNKFHELFEGIKQTYYNMASKCIENLDQSGFVLVPKEPTEEMIEAGLWADFNHYRGECATREQIIHLYKAMIGAANE